MSGVSPVDDPESRVGAIREQVREAMITGTALTIPLLVTVLVSAFAVDFVAGAVEPVATFLQNEVGVGRDAPVALLQVLTLVTVVLVVFVVGVVAEVRSGSRIDELFDSVMGRIPGFGAVYSSFNQMSQMLMSNDARTFQEVYLVEYPSEGSYSLAFVTADTPEFVLEATGNDEMVTLFMPMAPNPVMGGFVVHVTADRVYDVDMTVEEGVQSIVTSGVATTGDEAGATTETPVQAADT